MQKGDRSSVNSFQSVTSKKMLVKQVSQVNNFFQ